LVTCWNLLYENLTISEDFFINVFFFFFGNLICLFSFPAFFFCLVGFPNSFALQQTKVIWRRYCFHPHSKYQFKCNSKRNMLLHNTSQWWSTFLFFICFHTVFNNSSLFTSISNLIWIDITIMDIKKTHINLSFHIHIGEVSREKRGK
jgi:hypothetical protein